MRGHGSSSAAAALILLIVSLVHGAVFAQDALAPLQGRWVVVKAEALGKPLDIITGGVMTVAKDRFEIRTAAGTLLMGTLRADVSKRPSTLDLLHADGEQWEAIYEISGGTLSLIYVPAGSEQRPTAFTTSPESNRTLVVLRREEK